jgi:uncharacterized SAM-binding protein YcdF (DUF218 family)
MFFILSKVLSFLAMPIFWIILAWYLYAKKRKEKSSKYYLYSALFTSFFFTNTVVFKEFCRLWEIGGKNPDQTEVYQVGIVLGGMFEYNNDLDVLSIRRGGDRIWQALSLYHRGKIKKFLISGAHGFLIDRGLSEAKQLKEELVKRGIPESDILIDTLSKNTYENAVESVRILREKGYDSESNLLITSSLHMRRSEACFRKQGILLTRYPTDLFTGPKRAYHWDEFLIPSLSTADDWATLTHEWLGYVSYKMMGYL